MVQGAGSPDHGSAHQGTASARDWREIGDGGGREIGARLATAAAHQDPRTRIRAPWAERQAARAQNHITSFKDHGPGVNCAY